MANIQIETVRTGDFSMDYFRFGHGKNILVILPGLSVDSVMKYADGVADAYHVLTDDFTVYLFDRRKELPDPYSISDMARDTVLAIRELGLRDICLFGASQGGMIAMTIAITAPDLVSKLALGSTAARVCGDDFSELSAWVGMAEKKDATALYEVFAQALYPKETYEAYKDVFAMMSKTVTEEDLSRFVIQAKGTEGFDVLDRLSETRCPVLLLGANDDAVLGVKPSEEIISRLSGREDFEYFMYDGYGHAAFDTAPDYKERLLKFFL